MTTVPSIPELGLELTELPATGGSTATLVLVGVLALLLGLVAWAASQHNKPRF